MSEWHINHQTDATEFAEIDLGRMSSKKQKHNKEYFKCLLPKQNLFRIVFFYYLEFIFVFQSISDVEQFLKSHWNINVHKIIWIFWDPDWFHSHQTPLYIEYDWFIRTHTSFLKTFKMFWSVYFGYCNAITSSKVCLRVFFLYIIVFVFLVYFHIGLLYTSEFKIVLAS